MKIKRILLIGLQAAVLFMAAACNRDASINDIPSVEEKGTINPEILNQMKDFIQGDTKQIEGNTDILIDYIDDTHFYQNTTIADIWAKTKAVPLQVTIRGHFFTDISDESMEFHFSKKISEAISWQKKVGNWKDEEVCCLFLDVSIANLGEETLEYTPGNLMLYARVEDDTYVSEGVADKRINSMEPGLVGYYGENINDESGIVPIMPGETVEIRLAYLLKTEYQESTLCIQTGESFFSLYNKNTKRYEPSTEENEKYIYIN